MSMIVIYFKLNSVLVVVTGLIGPVSGCCVYETVIEVMSGVIVKFTAVVVG